MLNFVAKLNKHDEVLKVLALLFCDKFINMKNEFKLKLINCTEKDLKEIGFDKTYTRKGLEKHSFVTLKIYNLSCAQANIIKQTALSTGTDCAVHRETITGKIEFSDCILSGTISQHRKIIEKLKFQPLKLSILAEELKSTLFENKKSETFVRGTVINWDEKPYLMGILNITPDSCSDGGQYYNKEQAFEHFKEMVEQGADFIDIGGESTRPFSHKIPPEEEKNRVIPVIEEIRKFDNKTIISIDTRNASTAEAALNAGADIINDISAGDWDDKMFAIVKKYNCPIILNHSKGTPDIMQNDTNYTDVIDDIYNYFANKIEELLSIGIPKQNIIIDPGLGFGKSTQQNYEIIERIQEFQTLGCPIMIGHSRKTFLKERIKPNNIKELDEATLVISTELVNKKINILRVHNIKLNKLLFSIKNFK